MPCSSAFQLKSFKTFSARGGMGRRRTSLGFSVSEGSPAEVSPCRALLAVPGGEPCPCHQPLLFLPLLSRYNSLHSEITLQPHTCLWKSCRVPVGAELLGRFLLVFQFPGSSFMCVICHKCRDRAEEGVDEVWERWRSLDGTAGTSESSRGLWVSQAFAVKVFLLPVSCEPLTRAVHPLLPFPGRRIRCVRTSGTVQNSRLLPQPCLSTASLAARFLKIKS